jgi:hypothetical protein
MEVRTISPRRVVAVMSVVLTLGLTLTLLQQRPASAAADDCTLTVSGPFIYVDMVFPVIEVECDSVKRTIHIEAALDMDGSQVAQSSRTCRRTNKCVTGLASDGIFVHDVPGDQRYCGHGSGVARSKGQTQVLPQLTSCEADTF